MTAASCSGESTSSTTPASTTPATTTPATTTSSSGDTGAPDTSPVAADAVPTVGDAIAVLDEPVDLAVRPGDDGLYLVERPGRVTVLRDGGDPVTVLDITDLTENQGEQGFLGLAFAPDGDSAYVNLTDMDGDTVVAEYAVGPDGTFDETSQRVLLTIDQPYPNHNGGDLAIGPDGHLYIGTGDGGAGGDPERRALDPSDLLGKMLRIDPDGRAEGGYSVPSDNPFLDIEGVRPELWAVGLRNPWRFSFDPATGDLWIADVGQGAWEEINLLPASSGGDAGRGVSLGWSAYEGDVRFDESQDGTDPLGRPPVAPVHVYEHGDDGCSVTGGEVYRGTRIPSLVGAYVFGDFCSGTVWALTVRPDGTAGERTTIGEVPGLVAVARGPDGELWALGLEGGVHPIVAG